MLNRQQTFETMVTHLRKQGHPARNASNTTCVYRGPNKTMCADGCLIPDDDYDDSIEGASAGSCEIIKRIPDAHPRDMSFLDSAQSTLHDAFINCPDDHFPTWFENRVATFAIEHGLEIPA